MLTGLNAQKQPGGEALTHRACLAMAHRLAEGRSSAPHLWVQVRRYHPQGPYVLCGQVVALGGDDRELFKVDTCIGTVWADGRNVRMCSGDGRCTCEPGNTSNGAAHD